MYSPSISSKAGDTTLSISPALSLTICSPPPDLDPVHPDLDSTGLDVWPSSLSLSRYLCAHPDTVANKNVLELGCGAAVAGLTASKLGAAHVILTDGNEAVITRAQASLQKNGCSQNTSACVLLWGTSPPTPPSLSPDTVLCCDCAYDPSSHDALVSTIKQQLHDREGGRVIVAEMLRWKDVSQFLRETFAEAGFEQLCSPTLDDEVEISTYHLPQKS